MTNILLGEPNRGLPNDVFGPKSNPDKVILVLVDGFGWDLFMKFAPKYPFLQDLLNNGIVSKLTSQFPSTTSAALTTLYSGLTVGYHGVYEWNYYEPKLDIVISPIPFSRSGNKDSSLSDLDMKAQDLFPSTTMFEYLQDHKIKSYVYINSNYLDSPFGSNMFKGADGYGFSSLEEGCKKLEQRVVANKNREYHYLYYEEIDKIAHKYGPHSKEVAIAVDNFCQTMKNFVDSVRKKTQNTLFLMTADHGQIGIDPKTTIYLNQKCPRLINLIAKNSNGNLIVPAGNCRDMFLHIREDKLNEAHQYLNKQLTGFCKIYLTEQLITEGFFGASVSKTFLHRVGNLVVLPQEGISVWWYKKGHFEVAQNGHHGGLSRDEIEIAFAYLELTNLSS